ncbi:mRNA interferase MazF [Azotobacter beijerinckii]|uniref:mRNA interferase MazF n=1 Tax=Azotobacter beijerinckii TaxID=170623 RepID=A0A1H9SH40_9GAMM|nr:type II toxin-antitoxin system PemK/MazF family toxin [Azotobacter beijerinckii]SER84271.1 mRNA interferase MazF [Azotobacter beijerinckii]
MSTITEPVRKRLKPGDLIRIALDPTVGSETQKTRPCIVMTEQALNAVSRTIIVVPLSTGGGPIMRLFPVLDPTQNDCGMQGSAVLTQMRALDPVARQGQLLGRITDPAFLEAVRVNLAAALGITTDLLDPR